MYRPISLLLFMLVASNFIDAQNPTADTANGHTATVGGMALNADGSRLASLDYSGTLLVWDVKTGKVEKSFALPDDDKFEKLTHSADGSLFAVITRKRVMVFDFKTLEAVKTLPFSDLGKDCGDFEKLHAIALSYDNNRIAVATYKYKKPSYVVVYDVGKSQVVGKPCKLKDEAKTLGLNIDGSIVGVGTFEYGKVRFYNTNTGDELKAFRITEGSCGHMIHFTPDGNFIVVGSSNDAFFVDARTYERLSTIPACNYAFAAIGNTVCGYDAWNLYSSRVEARTLSVYRVPGANPVIKFEITLSEIPATAEFRQFPGCMALSPDGRLVAIGRSDGLIKVIGLETHSSLADLGSIKTLEQMGNIAGQKALVPQSSLAEMGSNKNSGQNVKVPEQKVPTTYTAGGTSDPSNIKVKKVERSSPPSITNFFIPVPKNEYHPEQDILLANSIVSNYLQGLTDVNYFDPFLLLQTNGINYNPKEYYRKGFDELKTLYSKLPLDYYVWGSLDQKKPSGEYTLRFGIWQADKAVADTAMQVLIASLYEKVYTALPVLLAKIGIPYNQQVHSMVGNYINEKNGTHRDMGEALYYFFEAITLDTPDRIKGLLANSSECIDQLVKKGPKYSWAYSNQGFIYNFTKPEKAIEEFQKALKLEPRNFEAMTGIAMAAEVQKNPDYMKYWKQVVDFNPSILMYANKYLSNLYYNENYPEGYPEADRLLSHYKSKGNAAGIALASAWKAVFGLNTSNANDFEILYKQVLAISPHDYNPDLAKALTDFGIELDYQGIPGKSLPVYELAYMINKRFYPIPNPEMHKLLSQYTRELLNSGDYIKSEPLVREFSDVAKTLYGENDARAIAPRIPLVVLYNNKGDYTRAFGIARELIALYEKNPDLSPMDYASALRASANSNHRMGNYGLAIDLYGRAIAKFRQLQNFHDLTFTMNSLGVLYYEMKDYQTAEGLFNVCLRIIRQYPQRNAGVLLSVYNNLGQLYQAMGNTAKSTEMLLKALTERENLLGKDHIDLIAPLLNLAVAQMNAQSYPDAERNISRAIAISEANPEHSTRVRNELLNNLAFLKEMAGQLAEAENYYLQAIAEREKTHGKGHPSLAVIYSNMARLCLKTKRLADSEKYQRQAIEAYLRQFNNMSSGSSEQQKLALANETRQALDLYFVYPTRLMPENTAIRTKAFEMWNNRKGLILEALRDAAQAAGAQPNSELGRAIQQLNQVREKITRLYTDGPGGRSVTDYQNAIAEAEKERDGIEQKVSTLSSIYADEAKMRRANYQQIAKSIPASAALLDFARIEFTVFETGKPDSRARLYYVFVVKSGDPSPKLIELGSVEEIDRAIAELKELITKSRDRDKLNTSAQRLYQYLLNPIANSLAGIKTLYIATDGQLTALPFEILTDSQGKFLVESHNLAYLTSARDLVREKPVAAGGKSIVIGNPQFDWADPGLQLASPAKSYLEGLSFPPLPSTATEATEVASIIGESNCVTITGSEATKEKLLGAKSPRILHIATHGFFLDDEPVGTTQPTRGFKDISPKNDAETAAIAYRVGNPMLRSGLVLAGVNKYLDARSTNKSGGVATAMDIMQMNLAGTELVALSACQTGLGKTENGEGVYGLQRAFLVAGAQNLLMSLWEVPDKETQELIALFYKYWLKEGKTKPEALRLARLKMIDTTRERYGFAHPFYWGAFVLLGKY